MKNILLPLFIIALSIAACNPKDNPPPEPEEYFNCEINGKYWTYRSQPNSWTGNRGIGAGPSGLTSYVVHGRDMIGPPQTQIIMYISGGNSFPDKDTFELGKSNRAEINHPYPIDSGQVGFSTNDTYTGKLIFTQRKTDWIKGIFYFDVFDPAKNQVIHITNGKFSIKL